LGGLYGEEMGSCKENKERSIQTCTKGEKARTAEGLTGKRKRQVQNRKGDVLPSPGMNGPGADGDTGIGQPKGSMEKT